MTRRSFEHLVHEGAQRIPEKFRGYLQDVAVVIEPEPTREQRRATRVGPHHTLFGLYEGTPRTKREYLPYRFPEKITLFQGPIEQYCGGNTECIREEVAHTIWHELAHALGFSERHIRDLEAKRGWTTCTSLRHTPKSHGA